MPGTPAPSPPAGPQGLPEAVKGREPWDTYDSEDVRPYAITGGRTRPKHSMRLVTLMEAGDTDRAVGMAPEAVRAVEMCRLQPCSVAEIAALIGHPVHVTKIILSDLVDRGALVMALPAPGALDQLQLLEALRSGLETRLSDVA